MVVGCYCEEMSPNTEEKENSRAGFFLYMIEKKDRLW